MSFSSRQSPRINRDFLDFIETAQYNPPSGSHLTGSLSHTSIPHSWRRYQHPIGDVYFHNHNLRLTTTENIRDPEMLEYILESREDHMQVVADNPNYFRLPPDIELVISDVTDSQSVIRMYSRMHANVYHYSDETGLRTGMREEFWSHLAEFPCHQDLPANAESEFIEHVRTAQQKIAQGSLYCFSEAQINKIIDRYTELVGYRAQGRNVTPSLAWLIGAVMPLEEIGRQVGGHNVDHILNYGSQR